jgi:hypothetical protein
VTRAILNDGSIAVSSKSKVVLADLVEELATADAQAFGGLGSVAAAGHQRGLDCPLFDISQQGTPGERLSR